MCFSDLLSLRKNRADQSQTACGKAARPVRVCGTSFILQITGGISFSLFLGWPREGTARTADTAPGKTDVGYSCRLKIKDSREKKKRSRDYRRQVRNSMYLHLAGKAFSQQKSLGDVLYPASLPGHTLEKQITGISLSFSTLSAPSLPVLPL